MLRLNRNGFSSSSVGQIINIMANDLRRLQDAIYRVCQVLSGIIDAAGAFSVIWLLMGSSVFPALIVALLSPVFGLIIIWLLKSARLQFSLVVDERSELMNDMLGGMKVLKMYSWEKAFYNIIVAIRKRELNKLDLAFWVTVLNSSIFSVSGRLMTFLSISVFIFTGYGEVNMDDIFVSLLIFNHLRVICFIVIPEAIIYLADVGSVLDRLKEVLLLPEVGDNVQFLPPPSEDSSGIEAVDISASWDMYSPEFKFSFESRSGELVVITGTVGSGKSSLLCALFGECPITSGNIRVFGKVAFAPQDPWILAHTVQENIVMEAEFDMKKYRKVVEVCALKKDFEQLVDGDQTLIGEKGSTLSGGQKARINLARALYCDADVYFLDSPFNAVDTKVFNHIFNKAILGYLAEKTVFLVASQTNCFRMADRIIVMDQGQIISMGKFEEVQHTLFLVGKENEREIEVDSIVPDSGKKRKSTTGSVEYPIKPLEVQGDGGKEEPHFASWRIYYSYICLGKSLPVFLLLILLCIIIESLFKFTDIWIIAWIPMNSDEFGTNNISDTVANNSTPASFGMLSWAYTGSIKNDMILYGVMLLVGFTLSMIFGSGLFKAGETAARALHDTSLKKVLLTNINYFATNSEEKILNDFTRDTTMVDEDVPLLFMKVLKYTAELVGCIAFGMIFRPIVGVVIVFILLIARYVSRLYMECSRSFKHLEASSYGPLFSHMGDTWRGLPVIRATRMHTNFLTTFQQHLDHSTCTNFAANALAPWFSIYQELVANSYIFVLLAFFLRTFIVTGKSDIMGLLALVTAIGFLGLYQHNLLQITDLDGKMISVERMLKYWDLTTEEPESEASFHPDKRAAKLKRVSSAQANPTLMLDEGSHFEEAENNMDHRTDRKTSAQPEQKHALVFHKLCLAYEGTLALKNLSFEIGFGEKVGVVGRTGAGKSSLVAALFRLTPIQSGSVYMNGINTASMPLSTLRRSMAIIPQDPVLFSGTVRMNLDPQDEFPDYQIWNVLKEVQLDTNVKSLPGGLSSVLKSGELSVGQRQLYCLARAILGNKKILVMDEATANIDHKTESILQTALSEKFKACTVIIIAHKIQSVLGCHRVMVLEKGEIFEFDSPSQLMKNENGIFYSLLKHSEVSSPLENHL